MWKTEDMFSTVVTTGDENSIVGAYTIASRGRWTDSCSDNDRVSIEELILDGEAPLMTDPPSRNSPPLKNPYILLLV